MWLSKKKKEIDPEKKKLLEKGKELGLNLDASMSMYELEHRIDEREKELNPSPKETKSPKRGEY